MNLRILFLFIFDKIFRVDIFELILLFLSQFIDSMLKN